MTLVVDASVVVKWYFEEPLTDKARLLMETEDLLVAPNLVIAEVANAAWHKLRRGETNRGHVQAVAEDLGVNLVLVSEEALVERALDIAATLDHPVNDCFYLAVSERWSAPLVTHDLRLLEKVRGTAWSRTTLALSGFETRPH